MLSFIETHNTRTPFQHGFRTGYSCATQLLMVSKDVSTYMELHSVFTVLTWISQRHLIEYHTIHQLKNSNICIQGNILLWISDFLSHRRQRLMMYVQAGLTLPLESPKVVFLDHYCLQSLQMTFHYL